MKQKITKVFDQLSSNNQLRLVGKKGALVDFVSGLTRMVTKAVTYPNVIHWFQENRIIIDKGFKRVPDFDKLLAKCQRDPRKEKYNMCIDSFPHPLTKMLDDGHFEE